MSELPATPLDQIQPAIERVRRGFDSGRTGRLAWRSDRLTRLRSMLIERESELLEALRADLGKSQFEGWLSEVNLVVGEIDHTLAHIEKWQSPTRVRTPLALQPGSSRIHHEPLGVVLIIGPWNYPLQLVLAPLVGALAAGCTAVLKPSEIAAHSSRLIAELLPEYLDDECVAVIEGGIPETTALLEQQFDSIFYTGNGTVGKIVMRAAAEHLTPVTLELGGKSPCIVDRDARLDVTVRRIVWGKFFNAGQTCVAPDYVLVDRRVGAEFLREIESTIRNFFGADPQKSEDYGRIINRHHLGRLQKLLDGGEIVCGGTVDEESLYFAPTVLKDVDLESPLMADEIFGPILPVIEVDGMDEAVAFVNRRPKPLALYVFSENGAVQRSVLSRTSSGGACVNDCVAHLGVPDLPFGGVGPSGMGAYHGRASFDTFSHQKSVLHRSTRLDVAIRYPPYDDTKIKWARRLA